MKLPLKLLQKNERDYRLTADNIAAIKKKIATHNANQLDTPAQQKLRSAMLRKCASESYETAYERYIGNNDLLQISYLEIGFLKSKAVGRIRYTDAVTQKMVMATGFLISNDLVLTNHHVFPSKDVIQDAYIEFDYALDTQGREQTTTTFKLDPDKFFHTPAVAATDPDGVPALDFALIGVAPIDETGASKIQDRGYLVLNPGKGKIGLGDSATIIQFPQGGFQQIAVRQNEILDISRDVALIYQSDTAPGSSGSPVFNDQWQIIALHSAGVAKKDAQGHYLDKDNKRINPDNNKLDADKVVWISNTGIRVSSICNYLFTNSQIASNPFIAFLQNPTYSDAASMARLSQPKGVTAENMVLTPASVPAPQQPLQIQISIGSNGITTATGQPVSSTPVIRVGETNESLAFESAVEDGADYSGCKGFDIGFLGTHTPLPALSAALLKKIATFKSNSKANVLKYYHYSSVQHALRKMPVYSAINVNGDAHARKGNITRQDTWLRDNRLDYEVQLNNPFYSKSPFDKGHMSRWEDANWGNTPTEANTAAITTCMFTNCCPQVPDLNRSGHGGFGYWGSLEKIILEKGIKKEAGAESKICVYNGPVLRESDQHYKGVQIPLDFWKIVVWENADGDFKTTAFILSQQDLIAKGALEELQFDKQFVEHQCSVAYLEKLTDLTFTTINKWDTFDKTGKKKVEDQINTSTQTETEKTVAKHSGTKTKTKTTRKK